MTTMQTHRLNLFIYFGTRFGNSKPENFCIFWEGLGLNDNRFIVAYKMHEVLTNRDRLPRFERRPFWAVNHVTWDGDKCINGKIIIDHIPQKYKALELVLKLQRLDLPWHLDSNLLLKTLSKWSPERDALHDLQEEYHDVDGCFPS